MTLSLLVKSPDSEMPHAHSCYVLGQMSLFRVLCKKHGKNNWDNGYTTILDLT